MMLPLLLSLSLMPANPAFEMREVPRRAVREASGNGLLREAKSLRYAQRFFEAAAVRGSSIADSELVLKKLTARASELPLALEEAKLAEEIRAELESEDKNDEQVKS